jgi:hypothetical protein
MTAQEGEDQAREQGKLLRAMLDFAQREKALEEKEGRKRAKREVEFVEVDLPEESLAQSTPSPMVEVALPGGVAPRIFAPSRLC